MEKEITAGIIGAVGAVVGAAIAGFKDEIKNFFRFRASKDNQYLLGTWDCTWVALTSPPNEPIKDSVKITSVSGNLVKGAGSTPGGGDWELDGKAADLAVSFSYSVPQQQQFRPGAVVLKKDNPNQMSGAWAEYKVHGDVQSGTTTWNRRPSTK